MNVHGLILEPAEDGWEIRGFEGDSFVLEIPDEVDGTPVTRIGSRAFCDHRFGEVRFPAKLTRVGYRAFSGCSGIRKLDFPESLRVIGSHAFYDCTNLEHLIYRGDPERVDDSAYLECDSVCEIDWYASTYSGLRETLDQLYEEVCVTFHTPEEVRSLVFTEFENYVLEVHPAKQFEEIVEGCGKFYRACVRDRLIDYKQYDDLLRVAALKDAPEAVVRAAMARLRSGHELGAIQKNGYLAYLRERREMACRYAVRIQSVSLLREFAELEVLTAELVGPMTDYAIASGKTGVLSYLMDFGGQQTAAEDDYDFSL